VNPKLIVDEAGQNPAFSVRRSRGMARSGARDCHAPESGNAGGSKCDPLQAIIFA